MGDIPISHEQDKGGYPIPKSSSTTLIRFPRTNTQWTVSQPISTRRYHEKDVGVMAEGCVEYIATRVVVETPGPDVEQLWGEPSTYRVRILPYDGAEINRTGLKGKSERVLKSESRATLRVWHEIPNESDPPQSYKWNAFRGSSGALGQLALAELVNIKRLTLLGSRCTSTLIDYYIQRQDASGPVAGGYKLLLLEKLLPGFPVSDVVGLPIEQQGKAYFAFERCKDEFESLGFRFPFAQWGPKFVWDSLRGRCYIANLEHAWYLPENSLASMEPPDLAQQTAEESQAEVYSDESGVDPMLLTWVNHIGSDYLTNGKENF